MFRKGPLCSLLSTASRTALHPSDTVTLLLKATLHSPFGCSWRSSKCWPHTGKTVGCPCQKNGWIYLCIIDLSHDDVKLQIDIKGPGGGRCSYG